jgi:hypothetical protein
MAVYKCLDCNEFWHQEDLLNHHQYVYGGQCPTCETNVEIANPSDVLDCLKQEREEKEEIILELEELTRKSRK